MGPRPSDPCKTLMKTWMITRQIKGPMHSSICFMSARRSGQAPRASSGVTPLVHPAKPTPTSPKPLTPSSQAVSAWTTRGSSSRSTRRRSWPTCQTQYSTAATSQTRKRAESESSAPRSIIKPSENESEHVDICKIDRMDMNQHLFRQMLFWNKEMIIFNVNKLII